MNCRTPLVSNTFGTNVVSTFAYAYDELSRRTQRLDTTDSALTTNTFSYNVRSELIDATMGTNTYSYAYDPIGNRQQTVENGLTNLYTANALNQYTAIAPDTPALAYDPDGNMTRNGDWTYIWDAENRLVEARPATTNLGSSLVQYMYDAQSRRIARREFVWSDYLGDTTWHYVQGRAYLYDGWNLLQERKPALVPRTPHPYIPQTNLFLTGVSGPIAASYLWGLDLSLTLQGAGGIGGLLQSRSSGTNAFPICDANGNITEILDDTATLAAHYEYDAYGNTIAHSADQTDANPFRFSSKYWDGETGFYDYGYRFYSSALGRWLSRDPIGELGGYNFYLAFNNNPISGYDALGLIVLKSSYEESTSLDELKELRSWLMSLPALPSLGEYQQALVNLQFWFNVDASRPSKLEISEEWLKRQPAVRTSITRLVQHFTTATGDKELGGKSGCEWAHDKLKGSAVGTVVDFPEGIAWQASVNPGPLDALYPAMGGFHFDGTGHFKIKKVDNKGTYEFIGSVDVSFTDPYDWHEGLGILVPLWRVNELKNPATKALLGIEGDVPRVLNITDGAMLKLKSAGLGKDYDMKGQFEIKVSKQCCVP